MEWDEYLDDGAFYREALDRLIREDNEFDPEPYEPREDDRYDGNDDDEEEEEEDYDDYEEEDEDRYEKRREDKDDENENEEDDDEDDNEDDVNEEEYDEEEEAKAFHEAVKRQNEEWLRQMQGDGLPESIFCKPTDLPRGEPRGFAREGSWLEDVGLPHGGISCRTHRQAALGQVFTPEPAI